MPKSKVKEKELNPKEKRNKTSLAVWVRSWTKDEDWKVKVEVEMKKKMKEQKVVAKWTLEKSNKKNNLKVRKWFDEQSTTKIIVNNIQKRTEKDSQNRMQTLSKIKQQMKKSRCKTWRDKTMRKIEKELEQLKVGEVKQQQQKPKGK